MKLIEKLMVDGKHVGYLCEDDGIQEALLKKLLYTKLYFHPMLQAGYKFYSYDPDSVEDREGRKIVELPEREATDDEKEWFDMQQEQVITDSYPDAYCSKYYSFHQQSAIEFRKEASYEINTRAELEEYLASQKEFIDKNSYSLDVRPLNAFVNPEALYSIDDIVTKPDVRYYYDIIIKRHKLRNFAEYSKLVAWLQEKGVLGTNTPTPIEFVQAYYKWGVDGIKDSCTEQKTKQNVDVMFSRVDEDMLEIPLLENREKFPILVDSKQYIYFDKIKEDIANIIEFKREPVVTSNSGDLLLLKRVNTGDFQFVVRDGWVSSPEDRMYFRFYTDGGYMYNVKVSADNFAIFSDKTPVIIEKNFSICSIFGSIGYTLKECSTYQDYYINNALMAKSVAVANSRIKVPPYRSNFDMLVDDGVSVPAAIITVCLDAYNKSKEYVSNSRILDARGKQLLTLDAFSMYNMKTPVGVLDALDITTDDISIQDLLDVINSREEIDVTQEFNLNGVPVSLADYCSKLTFVQKVIDGEVTINNFGDGEIKDKISSVQQVYRLLKTCAYAVCGADATKEELLAFIDGFENNRYFDTDASFMFCDNAYKGCIKDFVEQRNRRGNAGQWLYCTAVYRELSNAPISEQRDYAMEVVTVPNFEPGPRNLRIQLTNLIETADMGDIPEELRSLIVTEAPFIAANLFFHILGGHVTDKYKVESGDYVVPLSTGIEGFKVKVSIPEMLYNSIQNYDVQGHRRIIPLNSYVQCEKFEHTDSFSWMITNAVVTPWKVHPKKGYKIKKYNFAVNYLIPGAFEKFSDEFKNNMTALAAKRDSLWNAHNDVFLVKWSELDPQPKADNETIDTITQYLDYRMTEDIHLYYKRWTLFAKNAKENGGILKTMILRSDAVFSNFAELYGEDQITENVIVYDGSIKSNVYLTSMEPYSDTESDIKRLATTDDSKIYQFNWFDFSYREMIMWDALISNSFTPSAHYYIDGSIIMFIGQKMQPLNGRFLKKSVLQELASKNICYNLSESKFLFKAVNGLFIVEALNA